MKIVLAAILFCLGVSAHAEFVKGACKDDIQKFCSGEKRPRAVMACLKQHESELSAGCKGNGEAIKEKIQDFMQACGDDAKKFCKGTKPGGGRILECLKQNQSGLSAPCQAAMSKGEAAAKAEGLPSAGSKGAPETDKD